MNDLIDFTQLVASFVTSNPQLFIVDSEETAETNKRPRSDKKNYWESKWGLMLQHPNIRNPKSRVAKLFEDVFESHSDSSMSF